MLPYFSRRKFVYKAPLTTLLVSNFISCYYGNTMTHHHTDSVYVDHHGVRIVTSLVEGDNRPHSEIFAMSVAGDGWIQVLALDK
jgi:hypothetical protein